MLKIDILIWQAFCVILCLDLLWLCGCHFSMDLIPFGTWFRGKILEKPSTSIGIFFMCLT